MFIARASHWLVAVLVGGLSIGAQQVGASTDLHTKEDVYERVVMLNGQDAKQITFFIKLPPGAKTGADVKGVFSFCTWQSDPAQIYQLLLDKAVEGTGNSMFKFAIEHQMALVSWTTFNSTRTYDKTKNFDEMTEKEAALADAAFDQIALAWKSGVDGLIKDYQLPDKGWFLYGTSRGGQWAHRLVLRDPELFSAIHIHICSSYDKPVPQATRMFWLVTTGELDTGYPFSKSFYAAARALNYPIIYNAEAGLRHDGSPAISRLSTVFFNYAWDRLHGVAASNERFVGNYETHEYVPAQEAARVPDALRVYLPTRPLADAWGVQADPLPVTR